MHQRLQVSQDIHPDIHDNLSLRLVAKIAPHNSGHVNFPKNADPIETLGRLETMNQIMHNRHDYDPLKLGAIPRPPTPSEEDKKKDAEAKKECTSTADPPKANLECKICHCNEKNKVREIKRIENIPLCWSCVWKNFHADAELAWNGN